MSQAKVLVLHGPNLNLLGTRQPEIYGYETLEDVNNALREKAVMAGWTLNCLQSNHEGALIDRVQAAAGERVAGCERFGFLSVDDIVGNRGHASGGGRGRA